MQKTCAAFDVRSLVVRFCGGSFKIKHILHLICHNYGSRRPNWRCPGRGRGRQAVDGAKLSCKWSFWRRFACTRHQASKNVAGSLHPPSSVSGGWTLVLACGHIFHLHHSQNSKLWNANGTQQFSVINLTLLAFVWVIFGRFEINVAQLICATKRSPVSIFSWCFSLYLIYVRLVFTDQHLLGVSPILTAYFGHGSLLGGDKAVFDRCVNVPEEVCGPRSPRESEIIYWPEMNVLLSTN